MILARLTLLASCIASVASKTNAKGSFSPRRVSGSGHSNAGGQCLSGQPTVKAPHANIWQALTSEEAASAYRVLQQRTGLNLTSGMFGSGNALAGIEILQPNKTDVLRFIDNKALPPSRYARATIMVRETVDPYLQDYIIGPLPATNASRVEPLTFLYTNANSGKIKLLNLDSEARQNFVRSATDGMLDVQKILFNATLNDTLSLQNAALIEEGRSISWFGFMNTATSEFDDQTLLPLGLYVGFGMTGHDSSRWTLRGWFYDGKFYKTTEEFHRAVSDSSFKPLPLNVDGPWAQTDRRGEALLFDELPHPIPVARGPSRFSVDVAENYVSWMDFSFYISHTRDKGLRLWDLTYKGKRILYELGLEEAIAHYAGYDPIQSATTYFDSQPGFGPSTVSLVDGYDCPFYSTYLNVTVADGGVKPTTKRNGVCLFEFDTGHPLQRHSGGRYVSVTKDVALTLRTISTIGNYDYVTSYIFHLDGSIEVSVRASGYIQSAFYAHNEEYGYMIHDALSGSMHTHVLTFKADFDVLGQKNSLQKVEWKPTTEIYPWSNGKSRNTMKVIKSFVKSEHESQLNWDPNSQAIYAVVNKDAKNKFGEYPGYRFTPATSVVHLAVDNSSNTLNAARYADRHFYVTKQKDTEAQAAHPYNSLDPANPLIDFSKFFYGESPDQEDLVVWFNIGMHHIPHTGDLPNTVFTTAHSAMMIEPLNYLEGDPSRATTQQVRVIISGDDKVNKTSRTSPAWLKAFGAENSSCSVDTSKLVPDLSDYFEGATVNQTPFGS